MLLLPITLASAGAAALINLWLAVRIGRVRIAEKISVGDGGNERLTARMRAHLNFAEYVPLTLILIGAVELARGTQAWLGLLAAVFLVGRVLHGFGMDGWGIGRTIGTFTTLGTMLGLGIYAVVLALLA